MLPGNEFLSATIAGVLVCVGIGLYIGLYLVNVPGSAAAVQTSSGTQLYLGTVPASELSDPHPTLGLLLRGRCQLRQLAAQDDVCAASEHTRARDDLQLRWRLGASQPVHQLRHRDHERHDARRQADADDQPRRRLAHLRDPADRPVGADQGGSRTTRRIRATTRRAASRSTTPRPRSHSARRARGCTAGSASCRARRDTSTGFGGPMQTVGYMDGFIKVV